MSDAIEQWVSGKVGFELNGRPFEFEVTVPATPVKPQRMLPVFQQLTSVFADGAADSYESRGQPISCKAGCGACCRQPVPVSETEVYMLAELVEAMEEPRRSDVKRRFSEAAERFNSTGWYERFADHARRAGEMTAEEGFPEGIGLIREYFAAGVACPFLEDECCSIHLHRPVSCREFLVTSPAEHCAELAGDKIRRVEMILKPSKALARFGSKGGLDAAGFPVLTRALELAERFPESFDEKPGIEWLSEFFEAALGGGSQNDSDKDGRSETTGNYA